MLLLIVCLVCFVFVLLQWMPGQSQQLCLERIGRCWYWQRECGWGTGRWHSFQSYHSGDLEISGNSANVSEKAQSQGKVLEYVLLGKFDCGSTKRCWWPNCGVNCAWNVVMYLSCTLFVLEFILYLFDILYAISSGKVGIFSVWRVVILTRFFCYLAVNSHFRLMQFVQRSFVRFDFCFSDKILPQKVREFVI